MALMFTYNAQACHRAFSTRILVLHMVSNAVLLAVSAVYVVSCVVLFGNGVGFTSIIPSASLEFPMSLRTITQQMTRVEVCPEQLEAAGCDLDSMTDYTMLRNRSCAACAVFVVVGGLPGVGALIDRVYSAVLEKLGPLLFVCVIRPLGSNSVSVSHLPSSPLSHPSLSLCPSVAPAVDSLYGFGCIAGWAE